MSDWKFASQIRLAWLSTAARGEQMVGGCGQIYVLRIFEWRARVQISTLQILSTSLSTAARGEGGKERDSDSRMAFANLDHILSVSTNGWQVIHIGIALWSRITLKKLAWLSLSSMKKKYTCTHRRLLGTLLGTCNYEEKTFFLENDLQQMIMAGKRITDVLIPDWGLTPRWSIAFGEAKVWDRAVASLHL